MLNTPQFSGLFNRSRIPTPTQNTLLSHFRDLPETRQDQVIQRTRKQANRQNWLAMLFVLLGSATGGVAGATMISPEVRQGMNLTPVKTVLLNALALPAAAYGIAKSLKHRIQDGHLQLASAGMALDMGKEVSIGGYRLSSPEDQTLFFDAVGQPARQATFAEIRQERVASTTDQ